MSPAPSTPIEDLTDLPYDVYRALWWRRNQTFRDMLKRGIEDIKAGRTAPLKKPTHDPSA